MILIGTSVISFLYLSFSFFNTDNSSSKDRACLCKFFISFLCSLLAALRCFTLDLSSSLLLFRLSSAFSTSSKEEYPHQVASASFSLCFASFAQLSFSSHRPIKMCSHPTSLERKLDVEEKRDTYAYNW